MSLAKYMLVLSITLLCMHIAHIEQMIVLKYKIHAGYPYNNYN